MANNNYQRRSNYQKRQPQGPGVEQQIVEGIFKGIWWLVSLPFKKHGQKKGSGLLSAQSAQQFAQYWQDVQAKAAEPTTRDLAIAEADKLLDAALKEASVPGVTMGDRLKASQGLFPDQLYNQLWEAHKLRNRLAHEVGVQVSDGEVKAALAAFQWGLRTLGVFV
jgi:hypothetical protein